MKARYLTKHKNLERLLRLRTNHNIYNSRHFSYQNSSGYHGNYRGNFRCYCHYDRPEYTYAEMKMKNPKTSF